MCRQYRACASAVFSRQGELRSNENVYVGGLGHVIYGGTGLPAAGLGRVRLFLELKDMLGSTSVVLDHRTAEVVEKVSYDVNGSTDADYRPARWAGFREDYRFTGKEEDIEVGLTYFGARYLNTNLRRWISPDPLTIHGGAGDSDPYAYVAGRVLAAVDLFGLDITDVQAHASGEYSWVDSNTEERFQFGSAEALAAARARSAPAAAAKAAAPAVKQAPRTGTKPPQTAPAPPAGLDPNVPLTSAVQFVAKVAESNVAIGRSELYHFVTFGAEERGHRPAVFDLPATAGPRGTPEWWSGRIVGDGAGLIVELLAPAALASQAESKAAAGGAGIVDQGVGSTIRKVSFVRGFKHAMRNHLTGRDPHSLATLDPGGSLSKWTAHIVKTATTGTGKVSSVAGGQLMEISAPMALENGGTMNVGVRLFQAAGEDVWRMTTVLTR